MKINEYDKVTITTLKTGTNSNDSKTTKINKTAV